MRSRRRIWKDGNTRVRTRFLWRPKELPITVDGETLLEARWLERASWRQRYSNHHFETPYWVDLSWVIVVEAVET